MNTPLEFCARYGKHMGVFTLITFGCTQCADMTDRQLAQTQGGVIGGAAGALIGNAIGGDTRGTLIGAAIGTGLGVAYGTHIANKKANYASTEDWLDACIVEAEGKRKQAVAYNQRLNNQLARLEKEVRMAKAAGDTKKLSMLKRDIRSERNAAQQQASAFTKEAEMQRNAINKAGGEGAGRVRTLRTSTSGIESQVSTMNKNVERYAALESQTDV